MASGQIGGDRHSKPDSPDLITDPDEKAKREALNALRQVDIVYEQIDYWLQPDRPFRLRPSTILNLHRVALEGISAYAGNWRPAGVAIGGSTHTPVGAHLVPEKIEDMCDYVNANWVKSAIHLSSYVMWRLNWIHPFSDGNGRTARASSYLVLNVRLGYRLPGIRTIPDQIVENREPYYKALEAADATWSAEKIDVSAMESLLESMLATQLLSIVEEATGVRTK